MNMTYGTSLQNRSLYPGLSGLDMDFQSILETGANLLPDGVQRTGQDIIDSVKAPAEEAIRTVAGERVLETIQTAAQQGIDAARQGAGLPPATTGNTTSGSTQTTAKKEATTNASGATEAAAAVAGSIITPWGIGGAVVGGGVTYALTGRMKKPPKGLRRVVASALVGVAAGIVTGMVTAK
ncbi:MAG: hypothetical protein J0I17_11180 ['Candidatus Kapabacteria' thiocyanatum]|uniref:Uncharacterized protein n=1 Tax=Candidatus Kapaibacterium thiocyanatum TaxID=1895771 RepID=A0A1M3KZB4_9BACT|nr:hypothetical protein ['Candidatus Kapabacteria' thiocyanatum]OJX57685.1 MAG: hypothetical protein BGO89_06855 ['Candidatus Kapabacteria' thiocyanatum]